ncbi:hypothetical protein [Butyrivibrio fibrisolvens]|uniref:hypothetical protein n=1 Tax=Butyrivibrio fibrisolvens TaxID=831 RepID=UPI0003FEB832|nr:hypothetical protein [Butyrivibrio fibrisolvens]
MKRIRMAFCIIMCVCLSGCVSKAEFEDLESRVSILESEVGIQNPTNSDESAVETDQGEVSDESRESNGMQTGSDEKYVYYVDTMSAHEVVEECLRLFDVVPLEGQSVEEYVSAFNIPPVYEPSIIEDGIKNTLVLEYSTVGDGDTPIIADKDAIVRVTITGLQSEMDGSIGYTYWPVYMEIEIDIIDYEKAAAIYDELYEILAPSFSDIESNQDGTSWEAKGNYNDYFGGTFLRLDKYDDGFRLYVMNMLVDNSYLYEQYE